jgi:phosphoribosylformylglycinamidine cyclo-ligase
MDKSHTYADAGVDIHIEENTIKTLVDQFSYVRKGFGKPISSIGHYAGVLDFGNMYFAITTDGVGSKVLIAQAMHIWNTVGIDCIAMNVNDLLAMNIEPIAFVDYLALEEHDTEIVRQIGEGLAKGAQIANVSIVGGETATLPDIICGYGMNTGFDLAGTCVGWVQKDRLITGETIEVGDIIIGIPSSGLHSNGYTLARKIIEDARDYGLRSTFPFGESKMLGEELLTPTRIYMEVLALTRACEVHGLAHITGGGLRKLKRLTNLGFDFTDPLEPQPIYHFLQNHGNIEDLEMYKTFNMGMGFVVIMPDKLDVVNTALKITGGKIVGRIVEKGIKVKELVID